MMIPYRKLELKKAKQKTGSGHEQALRNVDLIIFESLRSSVACMELAEYRRSSALTFPYYASSIRAT